MKVLLVSSYRVSCGIATYAEVLETLLARAFDVTVYALDQSILKSRVPHVVKVGDRQIQELCATFKDFDVVNLQWEPGLLGDETSHITRRLGMILAAADKLILTVHTVVPYPRQKTVLGFLQHMRKFGLSRFYGYLLDRTHSYEKETYRLLHERAKSSKKTFVAVHTPRETEFFKNVVGFEHVYDHPLSLIQAGWPERLAEDGPRARRELESAFPDRKRFIGVFGFLSEYKGITTALRAMKLLDKDSQLLIYGGVHPGALQERQSVNPYVKSLMSEIEADVAKSPPSTRSKDDDPAHKDDAGEYALGDLDARDIPRDSIDGLGTPEAAAGAEAPGGRGKPDRISGATSGSDDRGSAQEPAYKPKRSNTLLDKVAFLGSPDDYEFALAISAVDVCVFPYLEVGQSGSGPVSMAIELGKPTITSRNRAFIELARYYPKKFEMIDIGNHIQLAQVIERVSKRPAADQPVRYDSATLTDFYGDLIRDIAGRPAAARPVEVVRTRAA